MTEFLQNFMHPLPNAVMTVIMAILAVYWLVVFLFGVGLDDLDLGFDFDVDIPDGGIADGNTEIDSADPEHEVATEKSPGFFLKLLNFLNVGRVPFMLVLSTFKFFTWIGTLVTTQFLNVTSWGLSSIAILLPIAVIAVFLTKLATNPLVKFFKEIGYRGDDEIDFLGRSGKMLSTIQGEKTGIAEFIIENNPIRLNVKSLDGEKLNYGEYVVVMDERDDKKYYLVNKEISIRNI